MKRKVFPIMVSTYDALRYCIGENVKVLYVYWGLQQEEKEKVEQILRDNGYKLANFRTKWGVFFAKGIKLKKNHLPDSYNLF